MNSLYTVAGRVGYVWPDRVLWYAKGGLAVGEVRAQGRCNTNSQPTILIVLAPGCPVQGTTRTDAGWTVGGGSELALTDNWSVKAETSYFNLGTGNYTFGQLASPSGANVSRSGWNLNDRIELSLHRIRRSASGRRQILGLRSTTTSARNEPRSGPVL